MVRVLKGYIIITTSLLYHTFIPFCLRGVQSRLSCGYDVVSLCTQTGKRLVFSRAETTLACIYVDSLYKGMIIGCYDGMMAGMMGMRG